MGSGVAATVKDLMEDEEEGEEGQVSTNSDLRALLTTMTASSLSRYEEVSEDEVEEEE